jgi:uncharacterized protein YecT (DUF1311 family)
MTTIKFLAASLGLALISTATARADTAYEASLKKEDANLNFSNCGTAYIDRAEAALSAAWKHAYGLVDGVAKKELLAEHRAWIAFKEKSCTFYRDGNYGREGQVLSFPACRARVIEECTKDLIDIGKQLNQGN